MHYVFLHIERLFLFVDVFVQLRYCVSFCYFLCLPMEPETEMSSVAWIFSITTSMLIDTFCSNVKKVKSRKKGNDNKKYVRYIPAR